MLYLYSYMYYINMVVQFNREKSEMTILNVYMSENEKRKLHSIVESTNVKSMSELVKNLIRDKVKVEEIDQKKLSSDIEIPDFVPHEKYVVFSNNSIVCIGDTVNEVTQKAVDKGISPPYVIKYKGSIKKQPEFVFMSLIEGFASQYTTINNISYPLLLVQLLIGNTTLNRIAIIDTGASICVLNQKNLPDEVLHDLENQKSKSIKKDEAEVHTVSGIVKKQVYSGKITILDRSFEVNFILSILGDELPFNFLLGRNILDSLDSFFFGKKQIFLLKTAE